MDAAPLILALDAGGTKTDALLASAEGEVLGYMRAGAGNYQAIGLDEIKTRYGLLIDQLLPTPELRARLAVTVCGLSGLDRPCDAERLRSVIAPLSPAPVQVMNDTFLILRAGTDDGVGIALVSGTGSNCVGANMSGARDRIGGLAYEMGDDGGGYDIGVNALRAAFQGADGRGPQTSLSAAIREMFDIDRLDALVDLTLHDCEEPLDFASLAPLVFTHAAAQDVVSCGILRGAGESLASSVNTLAARLFSAEDDFPVVFGGSVLQRCATEHMRATIIDLIAERFPRARCVILQDPPIVGAALYGLDALDLSPADLEASAARIRIALTLPPTVIHEGARL